MSTGMGGMGQDMARQSLAAEMVERDRPGRAPVPDVERKPEPDERPDSHAQWDEIEGTWVVWNEGEQRWVIVDDHEPSRDD